MKHYLVSLVLLLIAAATIVGCSSNDEKFKVIEKVITKEIKQPFSVDDYPQAKAYLEEEIKSCGKGVVVHECEGDVCEVEENNCTHVVKADYDFFARFKLGLNHDKDDENNGKQWIMPTAAEIAATPEAWDIRDLNPAVSQVKINRQTCGSCWAESSQKLLDLQVAVNDGKVIDSSVQYLVSTCVPTGDCGGGYMTTPDHIIKNKFGGSGLPFWVDDPYLGTNSSCKWSKEQMAKGWEYKLKSAPWVGSSLMHSKGRPRDYRGNTAEMIKALMYKYKSGALVTVSAYDVAGNGIVSSCSFGGTNHMVVIPGWGKENGVEYASVWNSWGKGHGLNGISRIKWECGGAGNLNRRLGEEARVYVYEPACKNQPDAHTGPDRQFLDNGEGAGVLIGQDAKPGQTCEWLPQDGLTFFSSDKCKAFASPEITTEYHLTAKTECATASAMVMVTPIGPKLQKTNMIRTPFGTMTIKGE